MGFPSIGEFAERIFMPVAASYICDRLLDYWYSHDHMFSANSKARLIKRLQTALPQIRAVMGIAEALNMKDASAGLWVDQFRLAIEASEDVIDELEYKKLEDMVKNQDEAGGSGSSSKKRKLSALNDETLKRLKEAVTMLDSATAEIEHLRQLAERLGIDGHSESRQEVGKVVMRESKPFLAEREVFGREVEMAKIIDWLKRDEKDGHLSFFGILGVGGVGKTTLVQFAYQEMCRSNYFDQTIWICVSTNLSVEDIMRKMLGELGESSSSGQPLETLQDTLAEKIRFSKILLILDDIWDDEKSNDWKELFYPLGFAQKGSKILFTTRMKSVADMLASVTSMGHEFLALQGLGEKELQMLFYSYAFHDFNPKNHSDLQPFGDQIVKMLRGNPLAAKVVGSLLNSHTNPQYWRRILNHGSLFNLELANDVVEVLKLSYYHLPADLQVCFRFCSIFPRAHKFDKDELIKMWMAVGIIPQQLCEYERPEDIGEDYFNQLLKKSFFEYSKSREGERYLMNDLLHELAQNVSYGECSRIEADDKSITIPRTVQHVSVHESEIKKITHLENLRSLVITTSTEETEIDMELFVLPNNLIKKSLRLLKIDGNRILELPEAISCLVHLRYLSIGLSYVSQQFKYSNLASIYRLYHLQVLEISTSGNNSSFLGIETTGISNLLKLRYMRFPDDTIQTIRGIHKLTSLQEFTFVIGQENGHRINELGTLNNLRHLSIKKIENIGDPVEAKGANLLGKNNLMSLTLIWTSESNPDNDEKIIDYLQPHSNLKELTIENYRGHNCPSWMYFWDNLKILHIYNCVSLDQLPDMPISLIEFRIHNVGLTSLPNLYKRSDGNNSPPLYLKSSIRVVEIKSCPNLKSLDGFLQQASIDLQSIEKIRVSSCKNLVYPQIREFGKFVSLKKLTIRDCPMLVEIDHQSNLLHTKLKKLSIANCGELDVPLLESASCVTTLKNLSINNCANISCIPSSGNAFEYLNQLSIFGCKKLIEHSVREQEHGVNQGSNLASLKISRLKIDHLSLLCIEPLRSLRFVSYLRVLYSSGMEALPEQWLLQNSSTLKKLTILNASSLKSLPTTMVKLSALQRLEILKADLLEELPELPASLKENYIEGSGKLHCCSENEFGSPNSLLIDGCDKLVEHPFGKQAQQAHGVSTNADGAWSSVVENLVSTAFSYLRDRMLLADSEAELKRIHTTIPQIRALMGIAEALKMKDPNAGLWVDQFRLAIEASEDILDELEYTKLEDIVKNQDKAGGSASSSRKRKISALNDEISKRLKEVVTTLDQVANSVKPLLQASTVLGIRDLSESQQETSKVLRHKTEREMFGREVEKKNIIGWLKQPTDAQYRQYHNVVEVSKLSYYHLPVDLQVCFRFLSIFPRYHLFDKNDLIKMWIASGFIRQQLCPEERPEDIGEDYFNHLLRKSFLEYSKTWEEERYFMHDLMYEFARNVSIGECCRIEPNDESLTIPSTIRHVSVNECDIQRVSHLENLRSLVITTSTEESETDPDLFVLPNNLIKKSLRLLKICGSKYCELPKEISCLVHLRYLSIQLDYETQYFKYLLPASIYKLYHLQVLEFSNDGDYSGIETTKMTNLVSLRHMRLPMEIMQTIHGIHKLIYLQELTFFVGLESGQRINELGELNNLRHVAIKRIENIGDPAEAKSANLLGKNNLKSLSLKWTSETNHDNPEQIIDYLQPHPNLMELTIVNYKGQRCPIWMNNSTPLKLSSFKLFNCHEWKNQLPSWQMPYLKILDIRDCLNIDNLPHIPISLIEFRLHNVGLTSLPCLYQSSGNNPPKPFSVKSSLRVVEIESCPNLISLNGFLQQDNLDLLDIEKIIIKGCEKLVLIPVGAFGKLLSLEHLSIKDCQNLTICPNLPLSLTKFCIQNVGVGVLPDYYQSSDSRGDPSTSSLKSSLREVEIRNCPKLTALNKLFSWQMPYLEVLYIHNCVSLDKLLDVPLSLIEFQISNVGLTSLPDLFQSSDNNASTPLSLKSSLRVVQIERCPSLISLNGFMQQSNLDLQSIVELTINACEKLVNLPTRGFGDMTSLIYLTIYGCPKLVAGDNQSNLLPAKLQKLSIENCGKLDVPLLESASSLATLTDLSINNCANITHIPSSENVFGSLNELCIYGCKKLVEYSSGEQAHGADQGSSLESLKLSRLEIDHLSLLLIEPLKSLRSVSYLRVWYCSGMDTLPEQWFLQNSNTLTWLSIQNASTLNSLPVTMERLTALEWLEIWKANMLPELPELPVSLRSLVIHDASSLRSLPSRMTRLTALEWLEIRKADLLEELPELPTSLKGKYIEGRGITSQFGTFSQSYFSFAQV